MPLEKARASPALTSFFSTHFSKGIMSDMEASTFSLKSGGYLEIIASCLANEFVSCQERTRRFELKVTGTSLSTLGGFGLKAFGC